MLLLPCAWQQCWAFHWAHAASSTRFSCYASSRKSVSPLWASILCASGGHWAKAARFNFFLDRLADKLAATSATAFAADTPDQLKIGSDGKTLTGESQHIQTEPTDVGITKSMLSLKRPVGEPSSSSTFASV